ncbi:hypothetical protein Tco_1347164 [Tanacetum coccineum]
MLFITPIHQMSNMSEDIQYVGSDTRPPMLDRTDFESWQQRIREQVTNFDEDVDDLALNMDHIYRWSIFEVHVMQSDVQNNYVVDSDADYTSDSNIIPYDQYVEGQKEHISVNATTLLKLSSELRRRMCGNPKAKTVDNAVEKTSRFGQQKATV